jgi:hypothetical protein
MPRICRNLSPASTSKSGSIRISQASSGFPLNLELKAISTPHSFPSSPHPWDGFAIRGVKPFGLKKVFNGHRKRKSEKTPCFNPFLAALKW